MNPYSHLVVASKLETLVNPEDTREYYWGTIAPDIRYPAALQRQQTHISSQRIIDYLSQHPHLKSFLQGYLIHCLSDEIELREVFYQHFPFSVLKGRLSHQQIAVILELFYFETEKVNKKLSGSHNEILNELGLSAALTTKFSQSISQYAMSSSFETRSSVLSKLSGLENDSRIVKYVAAARSFQRNWLLKNGLFFAIRTGKISEQIVSMVASVYQKNRPTNI
jgi:hypothetical protein